MGKRSRRLRSPKYARKTAARREVIARLKTQRGVTSAASAVTVEEEQKVPNALKTLKTEKPETTATEENNTTPNKNTETPTPRTTTRKAPAKRTRRTRKKTTTSATKKTTKKTN